MADQTSRPPLWIKALAGLMALAFAANAAMVWMSQRGRRDLVRPDYYAAGLAEDARMARRAAAAGYRIALAPTAEGWRVEAAPVQGISPAAVAGTRCRVAFRRPEDDREDRILSLAWTGEESGAGRWEGTGARLKPGRYDVTVEWERDGETFMEKSFPWDADG
jgi:nitrogen fixation protein FixH